MSMKGIGIVSCVVAMLFSSVALAQEAPNSDAATLPSPGVFMLRQQFRVTNYDSSDPLNHQRDITDYTLMTRLSYGFARDWSINFEQPITFRRIDEARSTDYNDSFGAVDGKIWLKWRPLKWDHAAIDTTRVAFTAGVSLPWGEDSERSGSSFSSNSFDPFFGVVMTHIRGRHGVNLGARYRVNFGDDDLKGHPHTVGPGMTKHDLVNLDASYVYRLWPQSFTADSHGAVYWTTELNSVIETNSDHELFLSPGLMYEASSFTLETSLQVPVWQEIEERSKTDWSWVFGVRVQW
jgi:hypothetical protein